MASAAKPKIFKRLMGVPCPDDFFNFEWSPDGERLVLWSRNNAYTFTLSNMDWKPLIFGLIRSVAWTRDGRLAVSHDDKIVLFKLSAGNFKAVKRKPIKDGALSITWRSGGDVDSFFFITSGHRVAAWDLNKDEISLIPQSTIPPGAVILKRSSDGKTTAVGFENGSILLIGPSLDTKVMEIGSGVLDLDYKEDVGYLSAVSGVGWVGVWSTEPRDIIWGDIYQLGARYISLSHDGRVLASSSNEVKTILWNTENGNKIEIGTDEKYILSESTVARFNPITNILAILSQNGKSLDIFDVDIDSLVLTTSDEETQRTDDAGPVKQQVSQREKVVKAAKKPAQKIKQKPKKPPIKPPKPSKLEPEAVRIARNLISDGAIESKEQDLLRYHIYSGVLSNFIRQKDTSTPLTLAIDAPWGLGKTSIIRMMAEELKDHDLVTVNFNAWRYQKSEQIWVALAQTVLDTIKNEMGLLRRLSFNIQLLMQRISRERVEQGLLTIFLYAFAGMSVAAAVILLNSLAENFLEKSLKSIHLAIVSGLPGVLVFGRLFWKYVSKNVNPLNLKLSSYISDPKYLDRQSFTDIIRKDFENIVKLCRKFAIKRSIKRSDLINFGKFYFFKKAVHVVLAKIRNRGDSKLAKQDSLVDSGRLVIFIDDLDCCAPPRPVEIIEAVNVILDFEHCVFVLGMDTEMIRASIETKYSSLRRYLKERSQDTDPRLGQRFLEKIVQLNFRIPTLDWKRISKYFDEFSPEQPDAAPTDKPVEDKSRERVEKQIATLVKKATPIVQGGEGIRVTLDEVAKESDDVSQEALEQAAQQLSTITYSMDSPAVRTALEAVVMSMDPNPRKIKRFVNIFRLRAQIAEGFGAFDKQVSVTNLARWVFLRMDWPEVAVAASRNPDILLRLTRFAKKTIKTEAALTKDLGGKEEALLKNAVKDPDLIKFLGTWTRPSKKAIEELSKL